MTEVAGTYEAAASQLSTVERVHLCVKLLAREYWERRTSDVGVTWACSHLAELLSEPDLTSDELASFCATLRDAGAVERLCELLSYDSDSICCSALHVLGNIAADATDSRAGETRKLVRQCGGVYAVLEHLCSPDEAAAFYAMGTVMNCCTTTDDAQLIHSSGRLGCRVCHSPTLYCTLYAL